MKRQEILKRIDSFNGEYSFYVGIDEVDHNIRQQLANLVEHVLKAQASGVSSKNEPCDLAGVSTRYKMIDIQLHDWLCIAITDNETKNAVCHFTTDGEIEGVIDMAKKITNILNGC